MVKDENWLLQIESCMAAYYGISMQYLVDSDSCVYPKDIHAYWLRKSRIEPYVVGEVLTNATVAYDFTQSYNDYGIAYMLADYSSDDELYMLQVRLDIIMKHDVFKYFK